MENETLLEEIKLIKSFVERFSKRESNPFHSMLRRKIVAEKKEGVTDAEEAFEELVGKYEFLPDGEREGVDAMLVNISGWRLKSILVKGMETMSEEAFQALEEAQKTLMKEAVANGNTLAWAIHPEDKDYISQYLSYHNYKDIEDRLRDCFEWFREQVLTDLDARDEIILRDYMCSNAAQRNGMNMVIEMIYGLPVTEVLNEILNGKNDYQIRRNSQGEMLYIDAKELVDQCLDMYILDGEKGSYISCYINGCEESDPSGWIKRAYDEYIHELMADDEGIRFHLRAIEEAGGHFVPSLSNGFLGIKESEKAKEKVSENALPAAQNDLKGTQLVKPNAYNVTFEVTGKMSFSVVASNAEEAKKKALEAMDIIGEATEISDRAWELKTVSNVASGKTYFL